MASRKNDQEPEPTREVPVKLIASRVRNGESMEAVATERTRQINVLGYDAEHDVQHTPSEWAWLISRQLEAVNNGSAADVVQRSLMKAGALVLAAMDALPQRPAWLAHQADLEEQRQAAERARLEADALARAAQRQREADEARHAAELADLDAAAQDQPK